MIYNLFGDMGFLVTIDTTDHSANILVEEIIGRDVETNEILNKEKYLEGSIKFDSCSHFWFGDEDKYLHLCGAEDFERHILLMQFVYKKAFELMGRSPLAGQEWRMNIKEVEDR